MEPTNAIEMGVRRSVIGLVLSVVGAGASLALVMSELQRLKDPGSALFCDVNPLIGCSDTLQEPVAHLLFGVPNSVVGVGLFGALAAIFAMGAFGVRMPRVVAWGLLAGTAAGAAMVVFFLSVSIFEYRVLCPYCLVVWAVVLALGVLVWTWGIDEGVLGAGDRTTSRYAWLLVIALYLVVVLVVVVALSDKIAMVL